MEFKTIDDVEVGDKASFTKTISESDVYLFAGISGDLNPAHTDAEYMKTTPFKQRVAHGVLMMGLMSTVVGMKLPGPGTILLSTSARFTAPVYFGDTITAEVEVAEKDVEKNRLKLNAVCTNQEGKTVTTGEFTVSPYVKK
jgi:3-hydroxybutyryl-CoA dehydratase